SLVQADRLRYDFSHYQAGTKDEISEIDRVVNDEISRNFSLNTELMAIDDDNAKGDMALFGEKYDEEVRVVTIVDYSIE
ncbi:hypothetical protein V6248_19685, partial [Pseudoalteromonas agarivorans]|uniref:hypothetical protein n=1 Tax=Pseudoalteromonas agarivorans TaxID=176102 RepID=UPI00311DFB78